MQVYQDVQGATNGVRRVCTYTKETNSLPGVHEKVYCSVLACAL